MTRIKLWYCLHRKQAFISKSKNFTGDCSHVCISFTNKACENSVPQNSQSKQQGDSYEPLNIPWGWNICKQIHSVDICMTYKEQVSMFRHRLVLDINITYQVDLFICLPLREFSSNYLIKSRRMIWTSIHLSHKTCSVLIRSGLYGWEGHWIVVYPPSEDFIASSKLDRNVYVLISLLI